MTAVEIKQCKLSVEIFSSASGLIDRDVEDKLSVFISPRNVRETCFCIYLQCNKMPDWIPERVSSFSDLLFKVQREIN